MSIRTLITIMFALAVGLLAGYLFFGEEHANHGPSADKQTRPTSEPTLYTCSMHPQIQRDAPGDCPICGMDLIPQTETAATDRTMLTMTEAAVKMARVQTTLVGGSPLSFGEGSGVRADGARTTQLTGRLALNQTTTTVQPINYAGRLERLLITYPGETVRAGQRIGTIYSPDLVVAQQELLEALRLSTLSPELVTAARNKLRNLKISDAQIAELEATGEVATNFPVYAERGGTVLEIAARVGDYVMAGATLYTLTDLGTLWALFDAYERDLAAVRVGDRISFTVASLPEQTFTARVAFIDPLIDSATRTASIRAEVNNRRGRLKPEMFVSGTITASAAEPSLAVPKSAVLWTGERSVVYVEVPDAEVPTYQFREVELGPSTGDGYAVLSGLEAGERVVTNGAFQLDAAAQLRNQSSMMNRDVVIRGREAAGVTALALPDYHEETSDTFREQLATVVAAYLPIKDHLVTTKLIENELIDPLRAALARVDMSLVQGDAHRYWMEQLGAITTHTGGGRRCKLHRTATKGIRLSFPGAN